MVHSRSEKRYIIWNFKHIKLTAAMTAIVMFKLLTKGLHICYSHNKLFIINDDAQGHSSVSSAIRDFNIKSAAS